MSTPSQVRAHLNSRGWREYRSVGNEIWVMRWPDAPTCQCNLDKPGIQVVVSFHEFQGRHSYEIDVTGQKPDEVWVKLSAYGIGDEILDVLDEQCEQLVAAWTLLADPRRAVLATITKDPMTL